MKPNRGAKTILIEDDRCKVATQLQDDFVIYQMLFKAVSHNKQ